MNVVYLPDARAGPVSTYRYHSDFDADLAARRLAAVSHTVRVTIAKNPKICAANRFRSKHLRDIRRFRIPGFDKHIVSYRVTRGAIGVVHVLHGSRDLDGLFGDTGRRRDYPAPPCTK